jgi:hypothetical protein
MLSASAAPITQLSTAQSTVRPALGTKISRRTVSVLWNVPVDDVSPPSAAAPDAQSLTSGVSSGMP